MILLGCGRVGFEEVGADAAKLEVSCTAPCGDVTGDGRVAHDDIQALAAMLSVDTPFDACLARVADTTGDGIVGDDDIAALAAIVAGAPPRCDL